MIMIKKIALRNFRGIAKGEIDLEPLTILVGPNNSGKTTILEALLLAHGTRSIFDPYPGPSVLEILSEIHSTLDSKGLDHLIFTYGAQTDKAGILYQLENGRKFAWAINIIGSRLLLRFSQIDENITFDNLINDTSISGSPRVEITRFTSGFTYTPQKLLANLLIYRYELINEYQKFLYTAWIDLVNKGISSKTAEWLSTVTEEKYTDLVAEPFGGKPSLSLYRSDKRRVRLGDVGDGIKILTLIRMAFDLLNPDILLWDDIESHMNPRTLSLLAMWIADITEKGKQAILTTHSLEATRTLASIAEKATIIRLDLQNGQLNTKKYSIEDIEKLKDIGIDLSLIHI